ncbi:MAG: lipocalin-like domain-containing protein [Alphaproteobacteria bacterium]|nr:lipocalin-like domain-containing protein [Alphaproteobacteria bacterium]
MERREFLALLGVAAASMQSAAQAEPAHPAESIAGRLIGTWSFVSSVNTRKDGSTFDRWGANPKGIFMFDRSGRYAQIIVGSESRVFGAKNTFSFGTYTVDEVQKLIVTHTDASSTSKFIGSTQNRSILLLTAGELKYSNPLTSHGAVAEVLWKRAT